MKKDLSKKELAEVIIKYLNKKGINLVFEDDSLYWKYEKYYSKFSTELVFDKKDYYNDKYYNIIKYHNLAYYNGINKRRTSISDGFCLKIYKNLMWIKEKMDKSAEKEKIKIDTKTKYCTELETYYKKLYKYVRINVGIEDNNIIPIDITCSDKDTVVYYSMFYKNNKYYLTSELENYEESQISFIID